MVWFWWPATAAASLRRPAFGTLVQRLHKRLLQIERKPVSDEGQRFAIAEAQILCVHFGEVASRAEARKRQRRFGARGHHDRQAGRLVLEQAGQQIVDRRIVDLVIVVDHQDQRPIELAHRVNDSDDVPLIGSDFTPQHVMEMVLAEFRRLLLDCCDEVGDEAAGIGIQAVDLEPGDGVVAQTDQLREQGGLSKAGRRAHDRDRRQRPGQPSEQPLTRDRRPRGARHSQLGSDDQFTLCGRHKQ